MQKILLFLIFIILPFKLFSEAKCGNELTAVLNFDSSTNKASMTDFNYFNEEFCDAGLVENNANLEVQLLDATQKVLSSKKIYFPEVIIFESIDKKDNSFKKSKIKKKTQFQNLKFSVKTSFNSIRSYKVIETKSSKIIGAGEVK